MLLLEALECNSWRSDSPELESVEGGVTLSVHAAKRAVVRHLTVCPFVVHKNHKYHN